MSEVAGVSRLQFSQSTNENLTFLRCDQIWYEKKLVASLTQFHIVGFLIRA